MPTVVVSLDEGSSRYEARIDGALAGFSEFQLSDDLIVFTHTEVDEQFEGQGVASEIVSFALDDVRARGTHRVVPRCPYVKAWIRRHPDYADLVQSAPPAFTPDQAAALDGGANA